MSDKFYFLCKSNPRGPLLVLDTYWEAQEMKSHPDYQRVDEKGEPIIDQEEASAPQQFLFGGPSPTTDTPKKRATLKIPNKKVAA